MKFLLQKAISLIDIGTSFIYYLLGRELNSHDIKIINYLFSLDHQNIENGNSIVDNFNANYAIDIINSLNKGKDLLLVTNEDNLNILQLCILKQRLNIVKALLEYGCDPNRGSTQINHSHYFEQQYQQHDFFVKNKKSKKEKSKSKSLFSINNNNSSCYHLQQQMRQRGDNTTIAASTVDETISQNQQQQQQNNLKQHRFSDTTNNTNSLLTVNINTIPSIPQSSMSSARQLIEQQQQQQQHQQQLIKTQKEDKNDNICNCKHVYDDDDVDVDDDEDFNNEDDYTDSNEDTIEMKIDDGYDYDKDDRIIIYDSPLLLACCIYNCNNLDYLLNNENCDKRKRKHNKQQQQPKDDLYSNYYNYYFYDSNLATDLNETLLNSSISSSSSSAVSSATSTTSITNLEKLNDSEITIKNNITNYLEIDDDDLYYQKYDLDFTLSNHDTNKNFSRNLNSRNFNENFKNLNELRLKLVDTLLEYGANKYQFSKLSENSLKYLNKKSRKLLEEFFKINTTTTTTTTSTSTSSTQFDIDDYYLKTKQITPLFVTLCFDDLELFQKLYNHQKLLFNYIKPNEYKNLILFAIKTQSKNCLIFLLKNLKFYTNQDSDILFYVISNINTTKIIDLLGDIGFNFNSVSNCNNKNTILNCLFESKTNNKTILSKILLKLVNNMNIKQIINQLNQQNEHCLQNLFECNLLIEKLFFLNQQQQQDLKSLFKLQNEFKETIKILLKCDADFLCKTGQFSSSIDCLFNQLRLLIKKQVCYNKRTTNLFFMNYLYEVLKEILMKINKNFIRNDCFLLAKFFELLLLSELYINEFESVLKIVKLLARFESQNFVGNDASKLSINSSLIKKFLTLIITQPNYLNSKQCEKFIFIKNLFKILINYGYNLNDTSLKYNDGCVQSNNLLHNLISILFNCQIGYQLDYLYELMIFFVQQGANPNLEPYELEPKIIHCQSSIYLQKRPNYLLAQLCSPFNNSFNLIKRINATNTLPRSPSTSSTSASSSTSSSISKDSSSNSLRFSEKIDNWMFYNDFSTNIQTPATTSTLLINHYKKFLNFFYEYMDTGIIYDCLKYRDSSISPILSNSTIQSSASSSTNGLYTPLTINSSDVLNLYLEKLCSNPRSLQSLTRRYIIKIIKKPLADSVIQLPLPIRLQDYLLFNEIK